jgi:hypothetical protein
MSGFNAQKDIVKKTMEDRKRFVYEKGNVKLDFTLRTDIKQELKDWKELMENAMEDVEAEIKKVSDKKE